MCYFSFGRYLLLSLFKVPIQPKDIFTVKYYDNMVNDSVFLVVSLYTFVKSGLFV